jgi:two-component system, OmpR family, sensor kinase
LSIRARLTSLFVLASIAVVAAVSALLIHDQQANASDRLDRQLTARIDAIELAIRTKGKFPYGELYGEVIDADYRILGMSSAVDLPGLLTQSQADFVLRNGSLSFTTTDHSLGANARFLAQRRKVGTAALVIAVGAGENTIHDAHRRLLWTLAIGGPLLVALTALGGWTLSGGVLRPVRRMTNDARDISQFDSSARLAMPIRHDEIWHLGSTLNAMLDRLETSYRRERSFVDDASHELRTPLSILRGELELALLHPGDAASTVASLQRSIDEVDRLAHMTDDLLVLARTDRGDPSARTVPDPVDALDVGRAVVDRRARTDASGVTTTVEGTATATLVGREVLERIVGNVLDNATRFAESAVTVTVTRADSWSEIRVDDDGPGFPLEFLPFVFERFSVASEARARREGGGTGLGLAIVRALTTNAGGTVEASNVEPHGARIVVRLPAAPTTASTLIEHSPTERDNVTHERANLPV